MLCKGCDAKHQLHEAVRLRMEAERVVQAALEAQERAQGRVQDAAHDLVFWDPPGE